MLDDCPTYAHATCTTPAVPPHGTMAPMASAEKEVLRAAWAEALPPPHAPSSVTRQTVSLSPHRLRLGALTGGTLGVEHGRWSLRQREGEAPAQESTGGRALLVTLLQHKRLLLRHVGESRRQRALQASKRALHALAAAGLLGSEGGGYHWSGPGPANLVGLDSRTSSFGSTLAGEKG